MINNFKMYSPKKNTTNNPRIKYGPKGISDDFSFFNVTYKAIGNARNAPIAIVNNPNCHPKINPKRKLNLISPPPRLSFLNIKSPNILNKYITANVIKP